MTDIAAMLAEFHGALDDELGRGDAGLRATLHEEEHRELIVELSIEHLGEEVNRARLARELADVVYVAFGTAHAFDIDLNVALAEIHRASMSKLDPACSHCRGRGKQLGEHHMGCGPTCDRGHWRGPCPACGGSGKGERVVREDGKILKPPGFVPPDMSEAVRA